MGYALKYYDASLIMRSKDPETLRTIDLWKFRSGKSHKWYIVEVEHFPSCFFGIKFYWKGVAASKKRYSLLTNDYEPRTIVMSCIRIMLHYFQEDGRSSFGFVAARDSQPNLLHGVPNKRFRFYRRMMLSLFSPDKFLQVNDEDHSVYLLVNRGMLERGDISIAQIGAEISNLYEGEFNLTAN